MMRVSSSATRGRSSPWRRLALVCAAIGLAISWAPGCSSQDFSVAQQPDAGPCSPGSPGCASECPSGKADCDGDSTNGCEADLSADSQHCGSCQKSCLNGHGTTRCSGGLCAPLCAAGFSDCDGDPGNGCEA